MKHAIRIFTFTICLVLLTSTAVCTAHATSASSGSVTELQISLAEQLGTVMGGYLAKDATVGGQVNAVISPYSTRLYTDTTLTEENAWLVYHQGLSEGTLAWIYHSQTAGMALSDAELITLRDEVYAVQRACICPEDPTDFGIEFFTTDQDGNGMIDVEECFGTMLQAVYSVKLGQLRNTLPSATAKGIVYAVTDARTSVEGLPDLETVCYETEDGENFELLYQQLRTILELQLTVDILYPSKTVAANTGTDAADLLLQEVLTGQDGCVYDCTTVSELNTYLKSTVKALLDTLKDYDNSTPPVALNTFHNAYLDSTAKAILQLTSTDVVSPAARLTGHATELLRADCKDALKAYAAAKLAAAPTRYGEEEKAHVNEWVTAYLGDGNTVSGTLDSAALTTEALLSLETERAKRGLDLYDRYLFTLEQIRTHISETTPLPNTTDYVSFADLKALAKEQWERATAALNTAASEAALDTLMSNTEAALDQLIYRADAERYRIDHHDILQKQEVTKEDLSALSAALDAIDAEVSLPAQAFLEETLARWCAQFKSAAVHALESMRTADAVAALRNEFLNSLITSANALSCQAPTTANASALRAAANRLLTQGVLGERLFGRYREILTASHYPTLPKAFRDTMEQTVRSTITNILGGDAEDSEVGSAITELNRLEAIGRVHAAAEGSLLTAVRQTVTTATAQINELTDAGEMAGCADEAIFSIEKLLLAQSMETEIEALRKRLNDMQYLSREELDRLSAAAEELLRRGQSSASSATTPSALQSAETVFDTELTSLQTGADASNLAGAKANAKQILTALAQTHRDTVSAYRFLSEERKNTILASLVSACDTACFTVDACGDIAGVRDALLDGRGRLNSYAEAGEAEEQRACVRDIVEDLRQSYREQDYSAEQQVNLLKLLQDYEDRLADTATVEEALALKQEAQKALAAIPNLLAEAQASASAHLTEYYQSLTQRKDARYSEENLAALAQLYETALASIPGFTAVTDAATVTQVAEDACDAMAHIPLDSLYTADTLFSAEAVVIPKSYNPLADGYSGAILSPAGLPADSSLSIYGLSHGSIADLLRQAAKDRRIQNGIDSTESLSKSLLKLLKNCYVSAALRIQTGVPLTDGTYTVSVLLSEDVAEEDVIGIVYRLEDGSFEFYEITLEEGCLTFVTTHLSDYYLVSEKTVNLLPWIILLCVIIACEALAIFLLTAYRSRNKGKPQATLSMMVPAIGLTKYRPVAGPQLLWLLGGIALLLGAWLVRLLVLQYAARHRNTAPREQRETEDTPPREAAAEKTSPSVLPTLPIPLRLPAPMTEVTVREADTLLSDTEVQACRQTEYHDPEEYRGTKRAEINIDVISRHFESGATVTLNSLKEKHLVPAATGHVKILARGCLDKPLTVVAQDFSDAALKMILLTGGTPIVTHGSPERGGKTAPLKARS